MEAYRVECKVATPHAMPLSTLNSCPSISSALSQCLVRCDGNAAGQVQAANLFTDGNPQVALWRLLQQRSRQAVRFTAEHHGVANFKLRIAINSSCSLRKKPKTTAGKPLRNFFPMTDRFPLEMLPIIQAGATQ